MFDNYTTRLPFLFLLFIKKTLYLNRFAVFVFRNVVLNSSYGLKVSSDFLI